MMKLAIVNGSPRGTHGNSKKITDWITRNTINQPEVTINEYYLAHHKEHELYITQLKDSQYILFIFPLYVDSMPAVVKAFFEKLAQQKESFKGKSVAFILHSGFPEALHSRLLERYVKYFSTKIMEMTCHGVVIMGGSEAIQFAPEDMFRKKISAYGCILTSILNKTNFTQADLNVLSKPEKLSPASRLMIPMSNIHWNRQLKKNNAFKKRFDQPYL